MIFISDCSLSNLTKNAEVPLTNYKEVLAYIVCEKNSEDRFYECYAGLCKNCPGIEKLKSYLSEIFEDNDIEKISYSQWFSTPITTLKNITEDTEEFLENFCQKIEKLQLHAFISTQQSAFFKQLKNELTTDEVIINLDFAENYAFIVQDAPPGFHWNNNQATVFVAYIYYKDGDVTNGKGFVVISNNLSHDTVAVYTFQQLIIEYLKNEFSAVKKIHYFSDGAPQQFKNYKNILNLYYHLQDHKIEADWHFFPTAHGKGACDGVGGSVKRSAAKASLRLPSKEQILTAESLYNWLSKHGNYENVEFRYSAENDYKKNVRKLNSRYTNTSRVKELQKQHYFTPLTNGVIEYKVYSRSSSSNSARVVD